MIDRIITRVIVYWSWYFRNEVYWFGFVCGMIVGVLLFMFGALVGAGGW